MRKGRGYAYGMDCEKTDDKCEKMMYTTIAKNQGQKPQREKIRNRHRIHAKSLLPTDFPPAVIFLISINPEASPARKMYFLLFIFLLQLSVKF